MNQMTNLPPFTSSLFSESVFTEARYPGHPNERQPFIENISKIGKIFLAITFGALYAGVLLSSLAALVERLSFVWEFLNSIGFQLFTSI